ncbi:hypothetical protein RMSM_02911 [Rhodopirellula maiorica SM1]|uniref:Uncharacterized protein n=1 Tax=Rhodopirellula maiorica SM1 TaxID=1265738 RepID=M5RLT0_9BACT|nr:hypothetical protein RMSM_02911 [Rhodopirellula maiorica SM1]
MGIPHLVLLPDMFLSSIFLLACGMAFCRCREWTSRVSRVVV